jgi:hypothetical protein
VEQEKHKQSDAQEQRKNEGHLWLNIGKTVFLVVVLVAAWFVLEWLMGVK